MLFPLRLDLPVLAPTDALFLRITSRSLEFEALTKAFKS